MLAGIHASYLDVELVTAVTTADDDGLLNEGPERFEDGLAELLKGRDVLRWYMVVDAMSGGGG